PTSSKAVAPPNSSTADLKGRRAAVPPLKRVLAEETNAPPREDPVSTGDAGEDDLFSGIVSPSNHAATRTDSRKLSAGHHPPANNKLIWIVCGSIAAVVLIGIGILGMSGAFNGPAPVEKSPAGPALL